MKKFILTFLFAIASISIFAQDTGGVMCDYVKKQMNSSLGLESNTIISCSGAIREIQGTGIPLHTPGSFPNKNNPNKISSQKLNFKIPLKPKQSGKNTEVRIPGVAIDGVKFEPGTAESYQNKGVWRYEAFQNILNLGLDEANAHVQPNGEYHYHGVPKQMLNGAKPVLIGWAGDGFPIYAVFGQTSDGTVKEMKPSYRLKSNPDSGRPSGIEMGAFTQDFEYIANSGDLDDCNGKVGPTPEFPQGIYHYYITNSFPYAPRCLKGTVTDRSFLMPPGGINGAMRPRQRGQNGQRPGKLGQCGPNSKRPCPPQRPPRG